MKKHVPAPRHGTSNSLYKFVQYISENNAQKEKRGSLILIVFCKYKQKLVQYLVSRYLLQKTCIRRSTNLTD